MTRQTERLELEMPDGQRVRGLYSAPATDAPTPAVLFVHGFGSTRRGEKAQALEAACAERGWAFAAADFRGHGESDGTMLDLRGARLLEDLEAIVSAAADRARGPVCLVGSSLGGWTSAWLAACAPGRIAACALIAPAFRFFDFLRLAPAERDDWRRSGRLRVRNEFVDVEISAALLDEAPRFSLDELAARFATPALLFHGLQDDLVPHAISLDFLERTSFPDLELILYKNGDHRLLNRKEEMASRACAFFAERLSASRI